MLWSEEQEFLGLQGKPLEPCGCKTAALDVRTKNTMTLIQAVL